MTGTRAAPAGRATSTCSRSPPVVGTESVSYTVSARAAAGASRVIAKVARAVRARMGTPTRGGRGSGVWAPLRRPARLEPPRAREGVAGRELDQRLAGGERVRRAGH